MADLSGPAWCKRFLGSQSVADLEPGFRQKLQGFLNALKAANATVSINATFRPPERAHLMHFAFAIAREGENVLNIPAMPGVDIDWMHRTNGAPDLAKSKAAAEAMVKTYRMKFRAALASRHTQRRAVDMDVAWHGTLSIKDKTGATVLIDKDPPDGGNPRLHAVGATYGVIKLVKDPPHWSDDGR
jgi:hypothetical protein